MCLRAPRQDVAVRVGRTLALCFLLASLAQAASRPTLRGLGGAVSSDDPYATAAGLAMLRAGGNAVDAAVATALALAVTYPEAGNLGGGGFAVVRMGGELAALDFREVAPAGANSRMYLDEEGRPIPYSSLVGPLASGVPGSSAGLWELHQRFGKLPWKQVVEPARRLASEGFVVSRWLSDRLWADRFLLGRFEETRAVWFRDGQVLRPGTHLELPDLARTLAEYAEKGPAALHSGRVAEAIVAASRRHGGILTAADLAAYRPAWRQPLVSRAFGWELAGMPLPSSGGVILAETAALLERLGWAATPRLGSDRAHLLAESFRRAFRDRFDLGDPSTTQATPQDLLAPSHLAARAASVDRHRATPSGELAGIDSIQREPTETTHLSVVDGEGNLVALTTTLNALFGCGLYVPGAGFFLNNEMDDFAAAPGKPNLFGLIQGEANAVAPGKRMLSSMSPTLAWRGREAIAVGGRGGSLIPTHTAQVLFNVIVDGDTLEEAIGRPRLHHQWLPDEIRIEPDTLVPEVKVELQRRGHRLKVRVATAKVNAVRLRADGTVEAAGEPRGSGSPGVVRRLAGEGGLAEPRTDGF